MKILMVAPQPFFINRGTPLAVKNLCVVLGGSGHSIDLLTSHIGGGIPLPGTRIIRVGGLPFSRMGAGFSWKKPLLDVAIALKMFVLVRSNNYDVVHCIEESAYIASIFRHWLGCPFVYDVDSSIPAQLSEKGGISAALAPLARGFETFALNKCLCAVTVCSALTEIVKRHAPGAPVFQIEDPPMIDEQRYTELEIAGLKRELQAADRKIVLYIGNFESYQGVELLMKSFAAGGEKIFPAILVIIGGSAEDVESKRRLAKRLGIADRVKFTGLLPPEQTGIYLEAADVLVSPRLKGDNTPMKIYTYMASGTAILATDLFTHTQVLLY